MRRIGLIVVCSLLGFVATAQPGATDSTSSDSALHSTHTTGSLLICISNAEEYDIVTSTVQVMHGTELVANGSTDAKGFLMLDSIEAGSYGVLVRNMITGTDSFVVDIAAKSAYELRFEAQAVQRLDIVVVEEPIARHEPIESGTVDSKDNRWSCGGLRQQGIYSIGPPFFDPYGQPAPKTGKDLLSF